MNGKRREISGNYRMELTADESCVLCQGTGISLHQQFSGVLRKIEVELSICSCLRIIPRLNTGVVSVRTYGEAQ